MTTYLAKNYLIIVISASHKTWGEDKLLDHRKANGEELFYDIALSDYEECWNNYADEKKYYFALVEQTKWAKYKDNIKQVKNQYEELIVWIHSTSGYTRETIASELEIERDNCHTFSHEGASNEPLISLKGLMQAIGTLKTSNPKELHSIEIIAEYLIKESIKKKHKPHLIALSYLCWGYLAAQGKIDLPKKLSISTKKKAETKERIWWEHVLKKEKKLFLIDKELEAISKEMEVKPLIDIIKYGTHENISYFDEKTLIQGKEADFTEIVSNTYKNLSEILEGSF